MNTRVRLLAAAAAVLVSCSSPPDPASIPPGCFAFGVFGDGPYRIWEEARFRHTLDDVNREDLAWFLHVGDIFWYPCSDDHYEDVLASLNRVRHPVIYTPGDNEWADCHTRIAGRYAPLDRLDRLRRTLFAVPGRSLGAAPMPVVSQGEDPEFAEFVENVRWKTGRVLCATFDMVGSDNAMEPFPGRTAEDDSAAVRRTRAAMAWLEETFAIARADSMRGVILAMHADPGLGSLDLPSGYGDFAERVRELTLQFGSNVYLVHGDAHHFTVDHPLWDPPHPDPIGNFTRIETFGSPDIGWLRVVVDSTSGQLMGVEPRLKSRWYLW